MSVTKRTLIFGTVVILIAGVVPAYAAMRSAGDEGPTSELVIADPARGQQRGLSPDSEKQAATTVREDRSVQRLVRGAAYEVVDSGPWTKMRSGEVLGAFVLLRFTEGPRALKGRFPSMTYDAAEASDPPYKTEMVDLEVAEATQLYVLIDQRAGRVVSVQPDPQADVTPGPDAVRRAPPEGGGL